jgi:hypothetical protein
MLHSFALKAQTEQRYNRIQYHQFHWRSFHSRTCSVYFTEGSDSLCAFITKAYSDALARVKKTMISSIKGEPCIIICPSTNQLYESNIGSFEPQQYTLPTFIHKGNRLLLFFNGSYEDLGTQLKEAIARAIWEAQFHRDGPSEQAKGAVKDEPIPMWFSEGAIRYFSQGWTIQAEDVLRRSFEQNNFGSWQDVINYQPRLSGQAFCYFLSDKYFKQAVAALYFQLKKKKQLARAIRLVVKSPLDSVYAECFGYYKDRFSGTGQGQTLSKATVTKIPHKKGIIQSMRISPDKQYIAYVLTANGKRTVFCYDQQRKESRKITTYQLPPWISDHSADIYPLISWTDKGKTLTITQPINGRITIRGFSPDGTEIDHVKLYGVDGVSSATRTDYRQYLLAAYRKGQGDIVSYNDNKEKYTPFTSDVYDDSHPVQNPAGGQFLFVSDRPINEKNGREDEQLAQGIYVKEPEEIIPLKVDSIPFIRWDKPEFIQGNDILATTTSSGMERFVLLRGKTTTNLTEYVPYQYSFETNDISFYTNKADTLTVQSEPVNEWIEENKAQPGDTTSPWLLDHRKRETVEAREDSLLKRAKNNNPSFLEDVFVSKDTRARAGLARDSMRKAQEYDSHKIRPYILQLHSAYFTAQVNNDYFINRYQPYLNYQGQFKFPEVGGMVQGGVTDLFENHHFTISYRLPAGSEGSDFFVHYLNTAKKVDWGLTYFRKVETLKPDPNRNWVDEYGRPYPPAAKVKSFYYDASVHYPLGYDCSLGLQEAIRNDRTVFLATNKYSLEFNNIESVWSITTLTGALNKLKPTIPNLFRGFKGNATVDIFKGFTQEQALVLGSTIHLQYHLPIYRYITLVAQAQGGYSVGDKKVLYTLGGVDNNVTPKVDSTVHFSQTAPYAFQSLVTPLRGYLQNSIYGNQYVAMSIDLYFPIFETLISLETPLPSINHLQLGLSSDLANAMETWQTNPNNVKWLYSYGLSARTTLAGYPLRFDIAWPGTFNKTPIWYLSLSLK